MVVWFIEINQNMWGTPSLFVLKSGDEEECGYDGGGVLNKIQIFKIGMWMGGSHSISQYAYGPLLKK